MATNIRNLTVFTGKTPNKATQSPDEFADNVYATHLFYDNTFVGEMKGVISDINTVTGEIDVISLNLQTASDIAIALSNYKGEFLLGSTYMKGDSVSIGNSRYASKINNNPDTPPSSSWITLQSLITVDLTPTINSTNAVSSGGVYAALQTKQESLVSGTSIKTVNNQSILGSGNITIAGGGIGKFVNTDGISISQLGNALGSTTGANNIGIGDNAGMALTTGNSSIMIGENAGKASTTQIGSTFIGDSAGLWSQTGNGNTAIGSSSLTGLSTGNASGSMNSTVGYISMASITTGSNNTAVGSYALQYTTTGMQNIGIGNYAGFRISSGTYNVAIGYNSVGGIGAGATGSYNTCMGNAVLASVTSGSNNVCVGANSAYYVTAGSSNTLIGINSGKKISNGSYNVAIGSGALASSGIGSSANYNTAVGDSSLANITSGTQNASVGDSAGLSITTGSDNTLFGHSAGSTLTSGANVTCVGSSSQPSTATVSNEITLGNASIATLRCQVTTITALSDRRDKDNIKELNAGLSFINELNPVSFTWNTRDGSKLGDKDIGFIAQELKEAQDKTGIEIPHLVYEANEDRLEAGYGALLPVMVKAIKEMSAKIDALEAELKLIKGE